MGYKDETYTFNGFNSNPDLKKKMNNFFPNGEKKIFCDEQKEFFPFEVVKNSMTQFFKQSDVQEILEKREKDLENHGLIPLEFTFTSSYEADKYYDIHFIYNLKENKVNMVVDSERQIGTIDL